MAYDKERSASRNGTGFNPKVVATKPSEQFTVIHKKKDVDVYSSNIIQYAGMGRQYHVFQPTTHRAIDKKHVNQTVYDQLNKIGFFNPRLNKVYTLDMNIVSKDIIKEIETDVICY